MPTLHKEKSKRVGSNKKDLRVKIYNDVKWVKLRAAHRMMHPFCEECLKKGEYKPMDDVHHVVSPFSFYDPNEIRYWAFNPDNVISLCRSCHNDKHK